MGSGKLYFCGQLRPVVDEPARPAVLVLVVEGAGRGAHVEQRGAALRGQPRVAVRQRGAPRLLRPGQVAAPHEVVRARARAGGRAQVAPGPPLRRVRVVGTQLAQPGLGPPVAARADAGGAPGVRPDVLQAADDGRRAAAVRDACSRYTSPVRPNGSPSIGMLFGKPLARVVADVAAERQVVVREPRERRVDRLGLHERLPQPADQPRQVVAAPPQPAVAQAARCRTRASARGSRTIRPGSRRSTSCSRSRPSSPCRSVSA